MPPKKAGQPKAGSRRTAFLDTVPSEADLTYEHALQLAGLAPASGFTLGSTAEPHGSLSPPPPPTAGPSRSQAALSDKGKGKLTSPIEISDSDDDRDDGRASSSAAGGDNGHAASSESHHCSRTKCAGNPNCLRYLGQEKWTSDTGASAQQDVAAGREGAL